MTGRLCLFKAFPKQIKNCRIFSRLWTVKIKTYFSWKNLKEKCCQAIDMYFVNGLKISSNFLKTKCCTLKLSPLYVHTHCNLDITILGRMESVVLNGPTYRLAITVMNVSNSKWKIVHCYVIYSYLYDNSNICNVLHSMY